MNFRKPRNLTPTLSHQQGLASHVGPGGVDRPESGGGAATGSLSGSGASATLPASGVCVAVDERWSPSVDVVLLMANSASISL